MKIGDSVHYIEGRASTVAGQVVSFDDETACILVVHTTWDDGDVSHDHQGFVFIPRSLVYATWEDARAASLLV